jgi:uncharacterized protein YbaP (TraB family)
MKKCLILACCICVVGNFYASAQQKKNVPAENKTTPQQGKKYQSLLWEITGNGLTRPSYLFGTMHVSDKLVFHLGDSFYNAIKSADVVALETNPETWQDDYSKSIFFRNPGSAMDPYRMIEDYPFDNLTINSFAIQSYADILKAALAVEPSMINGMLYRTYGTQIDDFEEDTFLDMYLFQVGKKLGKRVTGVENFQESEKLVMEAYRDMIRDQNKKRRSYDYEGLMNNPKKIEDAYRNGDLDVLDSLENLSVFSDAFEEKFLYRRNMIQANSIDSIIRKSSLFVGVGAAHLPGRRGVIELLRAKGYHLRPVQMDERNSVQKETIDKIHLPFEFKTQRSPDNFYSVAIPGEKFYKFTKWSGMDILQYADMVNGAYYTVNRVKTNSLFFGDNAETVLRKIDSLLYENIPGKILKRTPITKNGYKGLEVVNRTRRGDYQRYNIFVTPFEVVIFKMSGNGEYVSVADDAQKFFNSIQLQESTQGSWQTYQPPMGGFIVTLPHQPFVSSEKYGSDRLEYAAFDKNSGTNFLIMKANIHNYSYFEEDTFELNLLGESYASSPFIDKELSRKFTTVNGYAALDCKYKDKDGSFSKARFVIQGASYYGLVARYLSENADLHNFPESFNVSAYHYPASKEITDTAMHFKVLVPNFKKDKQEEDESGSKMQELMRLIYRGEEDEDAYPNLGQSKTKFFGSDTTGEKIYVVYQSYSPYNFVKDSTHIWTDEETRDNDDWTEDTTFIYRLKKNYTLPNGTRCRDMEVSDTGSSRVLISRSFYKGGNLYSIYALTDTLSKRSTFIDDFFRTFTPIDSVQKESLFTRKTEKFFHDYFSKDSVVSKKARRALYQMKFDSVDVPLVIRAIDSLSWSNRNYLQTKKYLIGQLGDIKNPHITPYLKTLYTKVEDTADLQHAILDALLSQETKESFAAFKDMMLQNPPISDEESVNYPSAMPRDVSISIVRTSIAYRSGGSHHYGTWGPLYDTLSLTKTILPGLLQLITIDDYKDEVLNLLTELVDSGYVKAEDYESYFNKIQLDAKQNLKKQIAREESNKIEKASNKDKTVTRLYGGYDDEAEDDEGNSKLQQYSVLLVPFWDKNPTVPAFFKQVMNTGSRRLLYETFILLLRNNKPVPDSLFTKYAALDEYRAKLYGDLKKMKKENLFPVAYKKQELIARSLLESADGMYNKFDTLVFIQKVPVTYKKQKGFVYFYKYKRLKDDVYWQLASVGLQPENPSEVDVDNDDFTDVEKTKLENNKSVNEQVAKALKELLYSKHPAANGFYEAREANLYRNYLPDAVKSNRYRD